MAGGGKTLSGFLLSHVAAKHPGGKQQFARPAVTGQNIQLGMGYDTLSAQTKSLAVEDPGKLPATGADLTKGGVFTLDLTQQSVI
jgi:hypothetical protein